MTILEKLPYVDGTPAEGQDRIHWILNGDLLNGSDEKYGNGGNLNESGVQIQQNVVTLSENIDLLAAAADISNEKIENISEILGEIAEGGIIESVEKNTLVIEELKLATEVLTEAQSDNSESIEAINEKLGPDYPENGADTVNLNLLKIKQIVGNEIGFDINGYPVEDNDRTGLIRKVHDVTTQTLANKEKIDEISTSLTENNIEKINSDVASIKTALGDAGGNSNSIYSRLDDLDDLAVSDSDRIDLIEQSIGGVQVKSELDSQKLSIDTLVEKVKTNTDKVGDVEVSIADINSNIDAVELELARIDNLVGSSDSDGMRGEIATITSVIGTRDSADTSTISGKIKEIDTQILGNTSSIQNIDVILGTTATGLQGDVLKHGKSLYGDSSLPDPVDKVGIVSTTKTLYDSLITTNEVVTSLVKNYTYWNKTFSTISDGVFGDLTTLIAPKIKSGTSILATLGTSVTSLNLESSLATSKTADVILINIGTYDYLFDTELGTIDQAVEDDTSGSFYSEVFKMFNAVVDSTLESRVFVTTGIKASDISGTDVKYPSPNTLGHKFEDYVTAINDVAQIFSIPVIDTATESGIIVKNNAIFVTGSGLNDSGKVRVSNLIAGSINSK